MKGKICGLLSALFITLGLSLSINLNDSSALKHQIGGIPLYNLQYVYSDHNGFNLGWPYFIIEADSSTLDSLDLSKTNSPLAFSSLPNGDHCSWRNSSYTNDGHWQRRSNTTITPYNTSVMNLYSQPLSNIPSSQCDSLSSFGLNGVLPMSWDSIPGLYNQYKYTNPYSFDYSLYTFKDSWTSDQGIVYDSIGLSFSDFLDTGTSHSNTTSLGKVSGLNIPIGVLDDIRSDDFTEVVNGTSIDFNFELYLTDLSSYDLATTQNAKVRLLFNGFYDVDNYISSSVECTNNVSYDDYGLRFGFSCPFVSSWNIYDNLLGFALQIEPGDGYNYIWDVTFNTSSQVSGDINFFTDSLYVVTNHDETPGNSMMPTSSGSDPGKSPGSAENQFNNNNAEPNWFDSLLQLFSFNFINPFAPIFDMFTNNESCVQIPTIAGMIHSEETQVCPWFNSTVRNITTPVLGIASMMLIFGFAVRWLGARSGNLFEDSFEGSSGDINIGTKGRNK